MPIDAGIYSQVGQNQVAPVNPLAAMAQVMQLRRMQQEGDQADRATQQQNKLLELVSAPDFATLPTAQKAQRLQSVGAFDQAGKLVTADAAASKDQRAADASGFEMKVKQLDALANLAGTVQDQASYDRARQIAQSQLGLDVSKWSPAYDPDGVRQFAQATLSAKDRLMQQHQQATLAETVTHNRATEALGGRTAATGEMNAATRQAELAAGKRQVVQGPDGPVIADMNSGTAQPVVVNGQPVGPKLKDLPVSVNTAILENKQTTTTLDRAIALLEGKDVGAQKGDKEATGWKGYLPNGVLNRLDPQGVDARAEISDIGSLKIHDRSGAAVTLSEAPRLMPFIPLATDDRETALKKLKRLKVEADNAGLILGETYSKEQGYKPSPVLSRDAKAPVNPPAAAPQRKSVGGKTYENDGKGWYEVK